MQAWPGLSGGLQGLIVRTLAPRFVPCALPRPQVWPAGVLSVAGAGSAVYEGMKAWEWRGT